MIAAYAEKLGLPDFLDGLVIGEYRDPEPPAGWVVAEVKAASLNPHDTWTLKGQIGFPFEPPVVLGCDGAGLSPDGKEVVFYPVIPTPDGGLRMLTDGVDGTFAPRVAVPAENLVPKPANLSFEEAAGLGTAWLTAYRMLFTKAEIKPGERLLIQGASGGVSTAAIMLAAHAGAHVTVTSRKPEALEKARELGAHEGVETGGKLPKRVDVVIETVGEATWGHSMKSLNQGGRIVVAGATTGSRPSADLNRLFYREIAVLGSAMGTLAEFRALCAFVEHADLHPPVSQVYDGVEKVREAMQVLEAGEQFGKLVIRPAA
ncbi:MAG TPA: zinc-binding dehydrogenase [Acidimicrobiia bacterium]|nr:zinc-binding dehydrogenase [Acidimicrobiia bacterium]